MSKEFKVPQLGENAEKATVAKVLVSQGDRVEKDQPVVELESDKAAAEVPCDIPGNVEKIHVSEGDEVEVGQTLLTLSDTGGTEDTGEEKKEDTDDKPAEQEEEEETAPRKQADKEDEKKESDEEEEPAPEEAGKDAEEEPSEEKASEEVVPAAPSVRRFAREIGVDIEEVEGSGPNGRISVDDVKSHARSSSQASPSTPSAELPDFSQWGEIERRMMSNIRFLTGQHMTRAASEIPQAVQFGRADITDLEELRSHYGQDDKETDTHLSLTVVLIKTMAAALKHFERFNASVDVENKEIIYKKYCHIGVAVDTERGLVVPVLRDVDCKSVMDLASELGELTERARNGELKIEEMKGGSMTLSNAGALGGDSFVPIVNWPEVAILGVAQSCIMPVYRDGVLTPRTLLPLTLSYDHRAIDGADAVRFMNWLVAALEEPMKLAWET